MNRLTDTRIGRAKLSIIFALLGQFVTLVCGIIVPRLLIRAFGSEAYGATSSIAQFLAYISLLEGGIGGVARAALYKPLSENNMKTVSEIMAEIKRFFRVIGYIFAAYVIVLALSFKMVSGAEGIDWLSSAFLVIAISISIFAEYFIGISYSVLIQAAQRNYITATVNMTVKIINTILVVVLVSTGSNLIAVKFVSSCVFVTKPVALWLYVRREFALVDTPKVKTNYLKDKWAGLAQHIAYFLHSNTDIAILTLLGNLKMVAVYSVYYMVVNQMQNFCSSFMSGMEAVFGDMLARNEMNALNEAFDYYETLISVISTVLFSVTTVMIVPFVRVYTSGVTDANYIEPVFAVVLVLASYVYCLRTPYHGMTIAAGHFRQTQKAAYGEAIINIALSLILVKPLGLQGVAIGTLTATTARMLYYAMYLRIKIFNRRIVLFIKREAVNISLFGTICLIGHFICKGWTFDGYLSWMICSVIVGFLALCITVVGHLCFYRTESIFLLRKIKGNIGSAN